MTNQSRILVRLEVPIYDVNLWLVSGDRDAVRAARAELEHLFGPPPTNDDWAAMHSYRDANFGLFIPTDGKCPKVLAHEIFHLTHRILEWTNSNFDPDHHEQGALLCGFLTELVERTFRDHENTVLI